MPLETRITDGILTATLNEPRQGNSFGLELADALHDTLKSHANSDVVGMILNARGRLFCAGGNLDDYAKMKKPTQGRTVNRRITRVLEEVAKWPHPTICTVTGDCYGGGVELISAFDKVLAVPEAMFGLWQRRIALTFGWGGGVRLMRRLPDNRLKQLALEARSFSSYEALDLGLVDEIHLRGSIESRAQEWLRAMTSLPQRPVSEIKKFRAQSERSIFERLWWNEEHRAILKRRLSR